ncbi:MAG TPA: PTS sugar transporter subunit IIA [Clostridiales bacterium]|nr:PTS sugar transporter subunit IIA [Clostridiales bacterium]
MFFKRKGEEAVNMPMLQKKNILINCKSKQKKDVINEIGRLLYESGYVDSGYTQAMIKREESFSTNIGNGIAIPHGIEESKKTIKKSGIAVMIFPEGIPWGEDDVNVVIGIAGVGDEHLDILANVAEKLSTPEAVQELLKSDVDTIYNLFVGKER